VLEDAAIQAAILRVKLKYVESWNEARRKHAAIYNDLFAEAGLAIGVEAQAYEIKTPGALQTLRTELDRVVTRRAARRRTARSHRVYAGVALATLQRGQGDNAANGTPIPDQAKTMARQAFLASRANAILSIVMLFFMGAASHYPMFGK
jgi:dTDP-4-amino-4,6-dideoxygalactose transaminase